jgi:hypothetical protein
MHCYDRLVFACRDASPRNPGSLRLFKAAGSQILAVISPALPAFQNSCGEKPSAADKFLQKQQKPRDGDDSGGG